jgi:hypothetical protein
MPVKSSKVMSLAAALAALTGTGAVISAPAEAKATSQGESTVPDVEQTSDLIPNQIVSGGKDLLGFIVTKTADGTVVAQHVSHASHSSHTSHTSSRY